MNTTIDYDAVLDGHTTILEAGVDFDHGTDMTALASVLGEARRRGVTVMVRRYGRLSEVEAANKDVMDQRRFPVIVVRAILQPSAKGATT